jgi:hypothetical protein
MRTCLMPSISPYSIMLKHCDNHSLTNAVHITLKQSTTFSNSSPVPTDYLNRNQKNTEGEPFVTVVAGIQLMGTQYAQNRCDSTTLQYKNRVQRNYYLQV